MANTKIEMVQIVVQYQIYVILGKDTVTVTMNVKETLCVELKIVNLSSGIAHQTLIAVKRVRQISFDINLFTGLLFCNFLFDITKELTILDGNK